MSPFVRLPFCAAKGQWKEINYRGSVFNLGFSINLVGSPLCMFAYLRLSLFSRPKTDSHNRHNVFIRALPFCAATLVQRCKLWRFCIQPRYPFESSTFVKFRRKTKPKKKAIVHCQNTSWRSRVRTVTVAVAVLVHWVASSDTGSKTQLISQVFQSYETHDMNS